MSLDGGRFGGQDWLPVVGSMTFEVDKDVDLVGVNELG